jgi:hypothetical protein
MRASNSKLLQQNSNTPVKKGEMTETAICVWQDMASWELANGFILACRVIKKIIENKGKNQWLSSGAPNLNVQCP